MSEDPARDNLSRIVWEKVNLQFRYLDEDGEGTDNEDNKIATKDWYFQERCDNEFELFRKYFKAIKKNRKILDIIEEVKKPTNPCKRFDLVNRAFYTDPCIKPLVPTLPVMNDIINSASDKIRIEQHYHKGRYIQATKDIPLGEVVIRERATVLYNKLTCVCIGNVEYSLFRCYHCARAIAEFEICPMCDLCLFCSRKCFSEAMNEYHCWECFGQQRHFWDKDEHAYLAMRMMFYGANHRFEFRNKKKPYSNVELYGSGDNNYPAIFNLMAHFDRISLREWNHILYQTSRTIIYLIEKTQFFVQLQKQYVSISRYDLIIRIGGLLVKHYIQAQVNNVIVDMPNPSTPNTLLNAIQYRTRGIYPTVALLNHSCEPNAALVIYDNYVVVKTITNVKMGDELVIAYYEIFPLLECDQRKLISENLFYFTCTCNRCKMQEKYPDNCFSCSHCDHGRVVKTSPDLKKALCFDCGRNVNLKMIEQHQEEIKDCTNKYESTHDFLYLENAACFSQLVYHRDSIKLFNVFMHLTETYMLTGEHPFKILIYGMKALAIMERQFPPAFFPLLQVQLEIYVQFYKRALLHMKPTKQEGVILKQFIDRLPIFKQHLKHYVSLNKIRYLTEIEKKLNIIYDNGKFDKMD